MKVMEVIAPRGSIRLEDFPNFEEFRPFYYSYSFEEQWRDMTAEERLVAYSKKKKKHTQQQCQGIKAFMKQHRSKRRNGHGQQR